MIVDCKKKILTLEGSKFLKEVWENEKSRKKNKKEEEKTENFGIIRQHE
jgi:hypothetical protein